MYCKNCGIQIGDFRFCPSCGTDQNADETTPSKNVGQTVHKPIDAAAEFTTDFTDKVKATFKDITGGDNKNVNFTLKDLWRDVFKKHAPGESEELLICGTPKTTPDVSNIAMNWNRPWIYSRVFLVLAATLLLLFVCLSNFENLNALPGFIFIGAMIMPFSLLVLFWETNIPRNISIFDIVKMFFVGGVASLVFALVLFSIIEVGELDVGGAILVGIIEEVGKLVAVAIFIKLYNSKYILNGILIGAAIGAGFAVFESAGYAFNFGFSAGLNALSGYGFSSLVGSMTDAVLEITLLRGILSAGGHIVWAAMSGAAIMLAKGKDDLSIDVFKKAQFWKLFPVPIVLHALWDMPWGDIHYVILVILVVLAWVFILALMRSGLAEISRVANNNSNMSSNGDGHNASVDNFSSGNDDIGSEMNFENNYSNTGF